MKHYLIPFAIMAFAFSNCEKDNSVVPPNAENHLKYFGFTFVDVGWDDP